MRPEMIEEAALLHRHWHAEEPPADLAARIVAHATRLPQHTPLRIRIQNMLHQCFHGWNMALIPATAAAALLLIGVYSNQVRGLDEDLSVESLVMDGMMGDDI